MVQDIIERDVRTDCGYSIVILNAYSVYFLCLTCYSATAQDCANFFGLKKIALNLVQYRGPLAVFNNHKFVKLQLIRIYFCKDYFIL